MDPNFEHVFYDITVFSVEQESKIETIDELQLLNDLIY